MDFPATIMLIGQTGVGKSSLGNCFTGTNQFDAAFSPNSVTQEVQVTKSQGLTVIDTPGTNDPRLPLEKWSEVMANGLNQHHISKVNNLVLVTKCSPRVDQSSIISLLMGESLLDELTPDRLIICFTWYSK